MANSTDKLAGEKQSKQPIEQRIQEEITATTEMIVIESFVNIIFTTLIAALIFTQQINKGIEVYILGCMWGIWAATIAYYMLLHTRYKYKLIRISANDLDQYTDV